MLMLLSGASCSTRDGKTRKQEKQMKESEMLTYGEDKSFLKEYCDLS